MDTLWTQAETSLELRSVA